MAPKYLDDGGLSYLWSKLKALFAGKLDTDGNAYRTASIPYGHVDSTSTSKIFTATVPGITELRDGVCILLKNGVVTSASPCTLNVNGLGAKPMYSSNASATRITTGFNSAYTYLFVYDTTRVTDGCWVAYYGYDSNSNTVPTAQCETAASTAAKTATCTNFTLRANSYILVNVRYTNTKAAALTLNINSTGAKPIYIDGVITSSTYYALSAGMYFVYYDGTNYYFRKDNKLPASITGDAGTVNGHTVATDVPSGAVFTDTTYSDVTAGGTSGLMSGSDKTKLDAIPSGAEVNQNAFSNVKVGSTTIEADAKTDTLEIVGGTNVTVTPDATNDKITIAATDTTNLTQMTGTLGTDHGGTGQTSAQAAANAFINALGTGSSGSTPGDNDYFISQYINGGSSNTNYYRRPMSALWSYISGKITKTFITNLGIPGTEDVPSADTIPASASISSSGLITFKNSDGTALFTLQLPLYNGSWA